MVPDAARTALAEVAAGAVANTLESVTLDFKRVGRSMADTLKGLAEAAACFANAGGGTVLVGVADALGGPEAFVGCELEVTATQRRIYELTNPPLTAMVDELDWNGSRLVAITVPSSPEVHAVGGRSTERVGTSCEPMAPLRIATVVADRRHDDWSNHDSEVPLEDVSAVALAQARALLEEAPDDNARAYARYDAPDLMRSLGMVTPGGTLTNAGSLLFTDRSRPEELIAYIRRRTPTGALQANERLHGPLLSALLRTFESIEVRMNRTSVNLPNGQQLQIPDLPTAAVREAIVNAVMHRDYRRPGVIQVEHSETRLAVTSPGPFVTGVTPQNVLTVSSRPRNAVLARAVRSLGLAETAGAGVDRMYVEMARVGHNPPTFSDDHDSVRVRLLGGAPNAGIARFVASLPRAERSAADTMLVLLHLLSHKTVTAEQMAPLLQKDIAETGNVLSRLASEPVLLVERTRQSRNRSNPRFRLREHRVAELGAAVTYRRRTPDEADRKVMGMVQETNEINARMVRLMLDLDTPATSRLLSHLVDRGILVKTSRAQRGPGVTYGPGPKFPNARKSSHRSRKLVEK